MTTTRTITICQDGDDLARRAAALFQDEARAAIAERGRFVVALSGGSTPEKTYGLLAQPETAAKIEWDKVFCFINDERFVNPEDANSNFGMVRRTLLSHVPLPASNIFPVATDSPTVEQAAADYETKIAEFFGAAPPNPPPAFDLIFLGLGDDGHTASLFPGKPSLSVEDRWVVSTPPGVLPPPVERITFTFPLINAARHVAFLVSGGKKAAIAHELLESDSRLNDFPAAKVMPLRGRLSWLLDKEAAAQLDTK